MVLVNLRAQAAGLDPHDRIDPRIVLLVSFEDTHADRVFLQPVALAGEGGSTINRRNRLNQSAFAKRFAGEDPVELVADLVGRGLHPASMDQSSAARPRVDGGTQVTTVTAAATYSRGPRSLATLHSWLSSDQLGRFVPCSTSCIAHESVLLAAGVVLLLPRVAEAGPPLLCHPFDAGSSPVLSWGRGEGWNLMDRTYDVQRLTADTLRLLSPDAPILARMENLRRATIYASQNEKAARDLLAAVLGRVTTSAGPENRLALFDAGYLIEAYRQASDVYRWNMLSPAEKIGVGHSPRTGRTRRLRPGEEGARARSQS